MTLPLPIPPRDFAASGLASTIPLASAPHLVGSPVTVLGGSASLGASNPLATAVAITSLAGVSRSVDDAVIIEIDDSSNDRVGTFEISVDDMFAVTAAAAGDTLVAGTTGHSVTAGSSTVLVGRTADGDPLVQQVTALSSVDSGRAKFRLRRYEDGFVGRRIEPFRSHHAQTLTARKRSAAKPAAATVYSFDGTTATYNDDWLPLDQPVPTGTDPIWAQTVTVTYNFSTGQWDFGDFLVVPANSTFDIQFSLDQFGPWQATAPGTARQYWVRYRVNGNWVYVLQGRPTTRLSYDYEGILPLYDAATTSATGSISIDWSDYDEVLIVYGQFTDATRATRQRHNEIRIPADRLLTVGSASSGANARESVQIDAGARRSTYSFGAVPTATPTTDEHQQYLRVNFWADGDTAGRKSACDRVTATRLYTGRPCFVQIRTAA